MTSFPPTTCGSPSARVVKSAWIKFRTLRSTVWTLASSVVVMVGAAAAFSALQASQGTERGAPASILVFSIAASMASLAIAVLGTLVITGEYSTGMIRSTLAAVLRRLPALWAKGLVLAVSIFLASTLGVALSLAVM
jgi:ABC-2 type transport system permease protein